MARHSSEVPAVPTPESLPTIRLPRDEDADYFGMTHPGKVREVNQDHFLIGALYKTMRLHATSLPNRAQKRLVSDPYAAVLLVAVGVGGSAAGAKASGTALDAITKYITSTLEEFRNRDVREAEFLEQLESSVLRCHDKVRREGGRSIEDEGMATTLTLVYVVFPRAYVIQVGDSRCYQLRDGKLRLQTRDQTLAQNLIDRGVLTEQSAKESRFQHVLSSAIGGRVAKPVTTRISLHWDDVLMLCTDGLTKHVTDDEIHRELAKIESAEHTCRRLIDLALQRGGSDNVTVIVVRLKPIAE